MKPYYQEDTDEEMLQEYLTEFKTPEKAASMLWGELPAVINSGAVKAYNTGASGTTFFTPKEVMEMCKERSEYFANRADKRRGSLAVKVYKEPIAGGAVE